MAIRISAYAEAMVGERESQQDANAIWSPEKPRPSGEMQSVLACVSDGMGGVKGGEIASSIACEAFVSAFSSSPEGTGNRLRQALDASNEAIRSAAESRDLVGMGCTFVGAHLSDEGLRWISIGDSRLLLYRAGELFQLNADHSMGAVYDKQAELGQISLDDAKTHPGRHMLRSALTGDALKLVDFPANAIPLLHQDCLILASDGINTLNSDAIADLIERNHIAGPKAVVTSLLAHIERQKKKRQDNATVLALCISDPEHASSVVPSGALNVRPISRLILGGMKTLHWPPRNRWSGLYPLAVLAVLVAGLCGGAIGYYLGSQRGVPEVRPQTSGFNQGSEESAPTDSGVRSEQGGDSGARQEEPKSSSIPEGASSMPGGSPETVPGANGLSSAPGETERAPEAPTADVLEESIPNQKGTGLQESDGDVISIPAEGLESRAPSQRRSIDRHLATDDPNATSRGTSLAPGERPPD